MTGPRAGRTCPHRVAPRPGLRLALLLGAALLAGGCWDYRDINDRSLVLGLAMDTAPGGGHRPTVELAVPTSAPAAAGGGRAGAPPPSPRSIVLTGQARTSSHALAQLHDRWSRPLSFGHLTALLYGEDYARREGIRDEAGCAGCHPEISVGAHVFVTRGEAAPYLSLQPPGGEVALAVHLVRLLRTAGEEGMAPLPATVAQVVSHSETTGVAVVPALRLTGDHIVAAGSAILARYRLAGWLTPAETFGFSLLRGTGRRGTVEFPCPRPPGTGEHEPSGGEPWPHGTFLIQHRSAKVALERGGDRPRFRYTVRVAGVAMDSTCPDTARARAPADTAMLRAAERQVARTLASYARLLPPRVRETGLDLLGWQAYLRWRHPFYWQRIRDRWPDVLRQAQVSVDVRVTISRRARLFTPLPAGG